MLKASHLIDEAIEKIKAEIDDVAVIGCSGGIDSSVATVLAHRAVGDLLHCVYVDTGMMRKDETANVSAIMSELGVDLTVVEASERFFQHLNNQILSL